MTLPASGALAMSAFNVEMGRSSSAQLSMSDSDLRGMIGKGVGAQFAFSELYGASFNRLEATLTEGSVVNFATFTGYDTTNSSGAGNFGSISETFITGGGNVISLFDEDNTPSAVLKVSIGADPGASYITSVTVGGVERLTSAASYVYSSGVAQWSWSSVFGMDGTGTSTVVIN